jgi:hypothetical protein
LFPGSVPTCDQSVCVFGPCLPDFYDYDGVAANGCEYACSLTNGGAEACDGLDNDCSGIIDDGVLPSVGDPCGASDVGECQLGALVCSAGALVCVGELGPSFELCDGLDNDCSSGTDEGCPVVTASDTRLDVGVSSGVGQATSTQLSVGSSGNLVVASYLDRRTGNADIRANLSTDGGVTWLAASDLVVATGASVQVEPWSFASSAAYVAFAQFPVAAHRDVYLARADAPFSAFGAGVRVDKNATNDDAFFVRGVVAKPGVADHVVVVWQGLSGTGANVATSVWLQRSLDGGATWLAADLKLNAAGTQGEFPAVCSPTATPSARRCSAACTTRTPAPSAPSSPSAMASQPKISWSRATPRTPTWRGPIYAPRRSRSGSTARPISSRSSPTAPS